MQKYNKWASFLEVLGWNPTFSLNVVLLLWNIKLTYKKQNILCFCRNIYFYYIIYVGYKCIIIGWKIKCLKLKWVYIFFYVFFNFLIIGQNLTKLLKIKGRTRIQNLHKGSPWEIHLQKYRLLCFNMVDFKYNNKIGWI